MENKMDIPIYLVSLNEDVGRRADLSQRFRSYYKDFVHVVAIDGRLLSSKEYYDKTLPFFTMHNRPMTPSELGCTLSHIKALETFLATDSEFSIIIEDDVQGDDEDISAILEVVESMPKNSLLFCGCQDGLMNRYKYGYRFSERLIHVPRGNFGNFSRTAAYAVSRSVAENILRHHEDVFITVADFWFELLSKADVEIFYMGGLEHPACLVSSKLEGERSVYARSVFSKILSKDMPRLLFRRAVEEAKYYYHKAKGSVSIGEL